MRICPQLIKTCTSPVTLTIFLNSQYQPLFYCVPYVFYSFFSLLQLFSLSNVNKRKKKTYKNFHVLQSSYLDGTMQNEDKNKKKKWELLLFLLSTDEFASDLLTVFFKFRKRETFSASLNLYPKF